MYNKKVLIDSLKNLGSAKAPVKRQDVLVDPSGNPLMSNGGLNEKPYKKVSIQKSNIQGKGLFADEPIRAGEIIGLSHIKSSFQKDGETYLKSKETPVIGTYYNHSDDAYNAGSIIQGNKRYLRALKNIQPGEEIAGNYYEDNDPTLETPDDFKKGGSLPKMPRKKNSRAYSRSLDATNKFFTENSFFAKPKSRKNKVFDPNSKYYQDGGEPCPEGYVFYNGQCVEWQEPEVIETDENTGYNAATGEISRDTRPGSIENNDWWKEHEDFHHLQNLAGGMSTAGFLGQRPNNTVASDQAIGNYYNRSNTELEAETDAMIKADPNLQFIPRNILQGRSYNGEDYGEEGDGFVNAYNLMYQDPTTVEGEARVREQQFEEDGKSIFPKKQDGGLNKFVDGGKACPKGYYYNGKICVKLSKNAFATSDPDEYAFRKAAYDDSLWMYQNNKRNPWLWKANKFKRNGNWLHDALAWSADETISNKKNFTLTPKQFKKGHKNKIVVDAITRFSNNTGISSLANALYDKDRPTYNSFYYREPYDLTQEAIEFSSGHSPIRMNNPSIPFNEPISYLGKKATYTDNLNQSGERVGYIETRYKKPVQPVVYDRSDKKPVKVQKKVVSKQDSPTTRTVYIDCPPGSVSNGQKTDVTTHDPDSPGNYLRTITTGCKPEKIENLQLLKPGLIDPTKDELQGNTLNEEVESEYLEEGSPDTENAMEWVNKRKYDIDWNGIQIPYRLPRFRKPGSYGDLIKPGKQRYINLPTIESRNTAYLREEQDGGITKLTPKEEKQFQNFYKTLPNNLQSDDDTYDIRGYWDSEQRPTEFDYTQPKDKDGFYHAYSINGNTGEYLKSPAHPTFQHAVDEDRKIGYRPITNVQGRNIAIENKSIADPEEQSFLRNTEGPINYIEAELDEDEIQKYIDGGFIIEDISVPELTKANLGKIVKTARRPVSRTLIPPPIHRGVTTYLDNLPIENNKVDLRNLPIDFDAKQLKFPLSISGESGYTGVYPNNRVDDNIYHFATKMTNPMEAGRAFKIANDAFPYPFPSILEPYSLSLDSYNILLNMAKRKDWDMAFENHIPLNFVSEKSKLFDGIEGVPTGFRTGRHFDPKMSTEMIDRINTDLQRRGLIEKAYYHNIPEESRGEIRIPNYKLTRKYNLGGIAKVASKLTPGNALRASLYKGVNPANYNIIEKFTGMPSELYNNTFSNDNRAFRTGMSLKFGAPEYLSKLLNNLDVSKTQWDKFSEADKMMAIKDYDPEIMKKLEDIGKRRLDAWAVGLKQPQEYNTLEQIGDNTYKMLGLQHTPQFFAERKNDIIANSFKGQAWDGKRDMLVGLTKDFYDLNPRRSQIEEFLGKPAYHHPWMQTYKVGKSPDPEFTDAIYDNDSYGVRGGYRWDVRDTPEGMQWKAYDKWDLNPFEKRGSAFISPSSTSKKYLSSTYFKPLQNLEALGLVGGKPFNIENNFLVDPKTFKIIKEWEDGGSIDYTLGDEIDEATMKKLEKLGYTFEKI